MFKIIWSFAVILSVPVLYIVYNYIKTLIPGQSKTYVLEPVYSLFKLFEKRNEKDNYLAWFFSVGACLFSLIALYMTVSGYNFLFVVSVLSMMDLLVITGAYSSGDSSGRLSARRSISRLVIWLFTSIVAGASIYKAAGTLKLKEIANLSEINFLIVSLPFTFVSLFVILLMKSNLIYFNFGISGKELSFLGAALYTPYCGWNLAVVQIAQWTENGVWIKIISDFLPFVKPVSFLIVSLCYLLFMFFDGFVSKVEWKKAARFSWGWAAGMAVINFICLYYY